MTAAFIDPIVTLTGDVDATGCNIGVYYDSNGAVDLADIHGANYFGVVVNGDVNNVTVGVTNSSIHDIGESPLNGSQHGNGIYYRSFGTGTAAGLISGNTLSHYQKNGITANGAVAATIKNNVVTGAGQIDYIAQNSIQIGFGGTANVVNNTVSGNYYTPVSDVACGILYYQADGVKASKNTLFANERDVCNFGKGGGTFNPSP